MKEVWLSSEDTGAYGRDIGTDLPALLRAITTAIEGHPDVMLRVGMTNPPVCGIYDMMRNLHHGFIV